MKGIEKLRHLRPALIISLVFWGIAVLFWKIKGNIFFLFNFGYIGTAVAVGLGAYSLLPRQKKPRGRRFAQLLVGLYMIGFLGFIAKENMQIEGFFFYLLAGFFAGSVIHYLVAKIFGPVIFGRGWCGWACWTAMVLDFLPYKKSKGGRLRSSWEKLRVVHFVLSLLLVLALWFLLGYRSEKMEPAQFYWLVGGNLFYFGSAIPMAFLLKDNRAFCKYLCPITAILKITCRFSLFKIEGDKEKCKDCGACTAACPMDIDIARYVKSGKRVLSTECIFCQTCTTICPEKILSATFKVDLGGREFLRRKGETRERGLNPQTKVQGA
jgi:ferredoxin-type protein NapH